MLINKLKHHVALLLVLLTFSVSVTAQQPVGDQYKQNMLSTLRALQLKYPGLGMQPVADNGSEKIFMSQNGRYVIAGQIRDLWDGTAETTQLPQTLQTLPKQVKGDDYYLTFGTGPVTLEVYVTFSCIGCADTLNALFTTESLEKFTLKVLPLSNNPTDKVLVNQMYCKDDPSVYFKRVFIQRDIRGLTNEDCKDVQSVMNNALAGALDIRGLPLTYNREVNVAILGIPTAFL